MSSGPAPAAGSVTAFTQTCPATAPAAGPFTATSWDELHPGAVSFSSRSTQTVTSTGGNPATAAAYDPVAGGGDACRRVAAETAPGTAVYHGPKSSGYTVIGLPTVAARITTSGRFGQLDARLWDVAPDGQQTLVTRGTYRLTENQTGRISFQLFGNAYRFEPKHRPKLELLGNDAPFLRPSNDAFTIEVSQASVTLPTREPTP
jgi:predicted acyl esterase